LEQAISDQTSGLQKTLIGLTDKIKILKPAIKGTQERITLASEGYSAGLIEYEEVLYAQKTELEMRAAYLQSLFLYHTMKCDLEFLSGSIN
jgi:outer membrane protein TolC